MNSRLATRLFILVVMVVLPIAWTGYMVTVNPEATISQQIWEMCTTKTYGFTHSFIRWNSDWASIWEYGF